MRVYLTILRKDDKLDYGGVFSTFVHVEPSIVIPCLSAVVLVRI